jgi:hypothetical protein
MEAEIRIQVPEGMEIDRENSTFECIKFKPKELTYQEIAKKFQPYNSSVCTNTDHLSKLIFIRKLLEVSDYLNGDWKADWNDVNQSKYFISYNHRNKTLDIFSRHYLDSGKIYFSSRENAEKAIEIIGEEELKQFFL